MHPIQDYIVLCLDVGPSMNIAPPSGGDTHFEMALRVANQIIQQKVCVHTHSYNAGGDWGEGGTQGTLPPLD